MTIPTGLGALIAIVVLTICIVLAITGTGGVSLLVLGLFASLAVARLT